MRCLDDEWLSDAVRRSHSIREGEDVEEMLEILHKSAIEFARRRPDVKSAALAEPRRGLWLDESRSFLRAVRAGFAELDAAGYVTLPAVRPKKPAGRYALLSKSGDGVSVNLEYIIQVGATAELVLDHGWQGQDVDFERGEFDALAIDGGGSPRLAMEAKARLRGSDSLEKLLRAWMGYKATELPDLGTNAGRKWRELKNLADAGPVMAWLVADGVRWSFVAEQAYDGSLSLAVADSPAKPTTLGLR